MAYKHPRATPRAYNCRSGNSNGIKSRMNVWLVLRPWYKSSHKNMSSHFKILQKNHTKNSKCFDNLLNISAFFTVFFLYMYINEPISSSNHWGKSPQLFFFFFFCRSKRSSGRRFRVLNVTMLPASAILENYSYST